MNKILVGALVTGAAVAAGVIVVKMLQKKDETREFDDFDDDSFDYPDPYDTDESIDFEINDDTVSEAAEDIADAAEDAVDAAKDAVEDLADAAGDLVDDIKDALD